MDGKTERHNTFGRITVGRVSSTGTFLFDSDAKHHHFVRVEIDRAEVTRYLSHKRTHGWEHLLDFYMSEAQWAQFVSSFGDENGTPVTLRGVAGKDMGECPQPEYFRHQFADEVKERVEDAISSLRGTATKLDEALKPGNKPLGKKALAEVLSSIEQAIRQVTQNLPYVEKCFNESMEKKMSEAKIEFEAIVARRLQEMGLESIRKSLPEMETEHAALPETI